MAALGNQLVGRCEKWEMGFDKKLKKEVPRVSNSLANSYIKDKFSKIGNKNPRGAFALLAMHGETLAAFVKGNMYKSYHGTGRVIMVDIICAEGKHKIKGAGSIIYQELEKYARSIGASTIMLFSVDSPHTVKFYKSLGYVRGPDACARDEKIHELAQQDFKKVKFITKRYREALEGEFFKGMNDLGPQRSGDTVIMTKCLGVSAPPSTTDWQRSRVRFPRAGDTLSTFSKKNGKMWTRN
jgi:hypothetical protein